MGIIEQISVKAETKPTLMPVTEIKKKDGPGYSITAGLEQPPQNDQFKSYIPNFLYKPPFGYPLNKNVLQLKELARNPFIFSIIRTLKDQASTTKYEIRLKKEFSDDKFTSAHDDDINRIMKWFYNPNGNSESFNEIIGKWIQDLCEVDAAVGVKVFNQKQEFSQLFARDGGSFLQNPDIYGYLGGRDEFVFPIRDFNPNLTMPYKIKIYGAQYSESAAYFQYGWTGNALPVPFGRREIMYIMSNPRTDTIYGRSPLEVIQDVLLTLVYGTRYNLDYFLNGNMPEGMLHLEAADVEVCKDFQDRLKNKFKIDDSLGNSTRVGHQYPVWGGPSANFIPFQISSKDLEIIEGQKWWTKLVWSAFGLTPDEMGYTEDSNKAVSQTQGGVFKRKALAPLLHKIEYVINTQLMPELDKTGTLEFHFEDYDLDEELKKSTLYKAQIDMGIKTPEMVAEEEGIDVARLQKAKEEERAKAQEDMQLQFGMKQDAFNGPDKDSNNSPAPDKKPANVKAEKDYLKMSLDDLIAEHKKLVKVLEEDNPEEVKKEAEDQKKELEDYIAKKKKDAGLKAEEDELVQYLKETKKELLEKLNNERRN